MAYQIGTYLTMALSLRVRSLSPFAKQWGLQHMMSSPHYPQSNGLAGKALQIAKGLISKAKQDNKDHILLYWNIGTPQ